MHIVLSRACVSSSQFHRCSMRSTRQGDMTIGDSASAKVTQPAPTCGSISCCGFAAAVATDDDDDDDDDLFALGW
eukprot:5673694-Pleurochrysis_carterae.AAC.1